MCSRFLYYLTILFIAFESAYIYGIEWTKTLISFLSILLFPMLFKLSEPYIPAKWHKKIMAISGASFIIYLFHTTVNGFIVAATKPLYCMDNTLIYTAMIMVGIIAGTLIPLWLAKEVFNRYKATKFMFGLK